MEGIRRRRAGPVSVVARAAGALKERWRVGRRRLREDAGQAQNERRRGDHHIADCGLRIADSIADSMADWCHRVRRPYNLRVHHVYIVRCADGTLYTGYAVDPLARERVHNSGRGARYTAGRRPVCLVYLESFKSRGDALSREYQLKRLSREKKEALVRASEAERRA